jgi:hypothetical protein
MKYLESGQNYDVWLVYLCSNGESFYTNRLRASTDPGCSVTPVPPTVTQGIAPYACKKMKISFPKYINAESYRVYYRETGTTGGYFYGYVGPNDSSYTNSLPNYPLTPGVTYDVYYKVLCPGGGQLTSTTVQFTTCGLATPLQKPDENPDEKLDDVVIKVTDVFYDNVSDAAAALGTVSQTEQYVDLIQYTKPSAKVESVIIPQGKITVYPNPTTDKLMISFDLHQKENNHIVVYDVNGRVMHSQDLNMLMHTGNIELNVENYPRGLYYIKLSNQTESYQMRFVKE